jgi:hypothetical protein
VYIKQTEIQTINLDKYIKDLLIPFEAIFLIVPKANSLGINMDTKMVTNNVDPPRPPVARAYIPLYPISSAEISIPPIFKTAFKSITPRQLIAIAIKQHM